MNRFDVGEYVVYHHTSPQWLYIAIVTGVKDDMWWPVYITGLNRMANVRDDVLFKIEGFKQ